jgi:MFS transporter, Spinster family, sphingosine-1-phosphate transporter
MGFWMLLLTRCFVGFGEGAYGPVAPTLLSDYYPIAVRGRVLARFYVAIPVGSALGYAIGGQVAKIDPAGQSWRWAFYALVIPGILLGAAAMLMREPKRGAADRVAVDSRRPKFADYLVLLHTPSYVFNTLGMTSMTFALGALGWWMSDYLKVYHAPDWSPCRHVDLSPVLQFGVIMAVAGLLATLAGGWAGDWLRPRYGGSYFLVSGAGLLVAVPFSLVFVWASVHGHWPLAWAMLFVTGFFIFFNTGPANTILANVTHPAIRATGFAVNIFVIHVLGDAISPPIIGAIGGLTSRAVGFVVVSFFLALGGVLWLWGARYLAEDTARATTRI